LEFYLKGEIMITDPRQMLNSQYQTTYGQTRSPLDGVDLRQIADQELSLILARLQKEYDRRIYDVPLTGPTRRQLDSNPALKNAWEEFMTVWKLTGEKNASASK
jgi:hypothetical protein